MKAYVTGPAALTDDLHVIGNASIAKITLFSLAAIAIMLLIVYRSIVTTLVQLFLTGIGLASSRGVIAVLGNYNVMGLTTFATNILTMLGIAAATDYGIFLFGRYREARLAGQDRESAYYTTFRSVAPVIIGSGLTIAGATYCLSFCRLPYFAHDGCTRRPRNAGPRGGRDHAGAGGAFRRQPFRSLRSQARGSGPTVAAGGHRGGPLARADPGRQCRGRADRNGRPARIHDELQRSVLPARQCAGQSGIRGCRPAFLAARMNPDILMIDADHDMRNPADMLVLDRVAYNVLRVDGSPWCKT